MHTRSPSLLDLYKNKNTTDALMESLYFVGHTNEYQSNKEGLSTYINQNYSKLIQSSLEYIQALYEFITTEKPYDQKHRQEFFQRTTFCRLFVARFSQALQDPSLAIDQKIKDKIFIVETAFKKFDEYFAQKKSSQIRQKEVTRKVQASTKQANLLLFSSAAVVLLGKITRLTLGQFGLIALVVSISFKIVSYWLNRKIRQKATSRPLTLEVSSIPPNRRSVEAKLSQVDMGVEQKTTS